MDFLSLLTAIPSLMTSFGGGVSPYQKQQKQLASKQADYSAALADTSNPLYKQLYGQYKDQGAANLSGGLAEMQAQNRLASRMGRTPFLDKERGGEDLFRQMMKGYQGLGTQADTQTRSALNSALSGTNQALQGYNSITPYTEKATAGNLQGYSTIANLLKGNNAQNTNNFTQNSNSFPTEEEIAKKKNSDFLSYYTPQSYSSFNSGGN